MVMPSIEILIAFLIGAWNLWGNFSRKKMSEITTPRNKLTSIFFPSMMLPFHSPVGILINILAIMQIKCIFIGFEFMFFSEKNWAFFIFSSFGDIECLHEILFFLRRRPWRCSSSQSCRSQRDWSLCARSSRTRCWPGNILPWSVCYMCRNWPLPPAFTEVPDYRWCIFFAPPGVDFCSGTGQHLSACFHSGSLILGVDFNLDRVFWVFRGWTSFLAWLNKSTGFS